jgi:type I restriction enzyme, S subunit
MNSAFMKRRLFDTARGAIGQANINSKELKAFPIAVPPLDAQQLFQRRCEDVVALSVQQAGATAVSEATFNILLSKAFTPALEKDMRLTFIPSI